MRWFCKFRGLEVMGRNLPSPDTRTRRVHILPKNGLGFQKRYQLCILEEVFGALTDGWYLRGELGISQWSESLFGASVVGAPGALRVGPYHALV